MKLIKFVNYLIIVVTIVVSFIIGINKMIETNTYDTLICLSIALIVLMPTFLRYRFKIKISPAIELVYLMFIFFSHFLGSILNLYNSVSQYDEMVHWLSGFLVSFIAVAILLVFKSYNTKKVWFNVIFILSFSLAIAASWEFFEFTFDNLFGKDAQLVKVSGVNDTMHDMLAALLGSILFCIIYSYEETKNKPLMVKYFIKELKNNE